MNRTVIVSLIQKNIDELILLTQGFTEMNEYPRAILDLAQHKTEDIRAYIEMLRELKVAGDVEVREVREVREVNGEADVMDIGVKLTENEKDNTAVPVAAVVTEVEEVKEIENDEVREVREVKEVKEVKEDRIEENEEQDDDDDDDEVVVIEADDHVDQKPELEEDEEEVDNEEDMEVVELEEVEHHEEEEDDVNEEEEEEEEEEEVDENENENEAEKEKAVHETSQASKITTLGEKMAAGNISRNDSMARENNGIHASIINKKVDDIRQAISLGDRFRFQRELFRNNGEDMNKTLNYINLLATYDEVVSFLQSKYAWPDDSTAAKDFYQIIKRKF